MTDYIFNMNNGGAIRIDGYVGRIDMDELAKRRWWSWTYADGSVVHINIAQIINIREMDIDRTPEEVR